MIFRRIWAYLLDAGVFIGLVLVSYYIVEQFIPVGTNLIMGLIIFGIWFVLSIILFGIVNYFLKGSIGKKIFDLRVVASEGWITPLRLYFRDIFGKYIYYAPFAVGLYLFMINTYENSNIFYTLTYVSMALLGLILIVNLGSLAIRKRLFVDIFFDTYVENDIPTAVEFSDIDEFIKEKQK